MPPTLADALPLVIFGAIAAALLVPLIWLIASFNRFVRLRQHIRESWADIDVELKRRHDLIPNLVETVKGYAAHERAVLERVTELRAKAATPHRGAADASPDENALALALGRVFALAEAYPTLRSDANFLALQRELGLTEDRLAAARRFFNANVREMNQLCASVPTNLVASMFGFRPEAFFELSSEAERAVPRVAP